MFFGFKKLKTKKKISPSFFFVHSHEHLPLQPEKPSVQGLANSFGRGKKVSNKYRFDFSNGIGIFIESLFEIPTVHVQGFVGQDE